MTLKQKIYNHYLHVITEKVRHLQHILADLKDSATNETKSTAGDKHETALAMLQIEQANIGGQLEDALAQQLLLKNINPTLTPTVVVQGSLIKTNRGYLFLSAAMGKAVVENVPVMALSQQAPLGRKLMGLQAGDALTINSIAYTIEGIE